MAIQTIGKISVTVFLPKGDDQAVEVSVDFRGDDLRVSLETVSDDSFERIQKPLSSSIKRRKHVDF